MRICLIVLLLAGCATHPVTQNSPDTFSVVSDNALGFRGRTEAKAMKSANAFCAQRGKVVQLKDTDGRGSALTGGASTRLVFTCVAR